MEQEQLVNRLQRQLSQLLTQQQAGEPTSPSTFSLPSSPVTRDLPLDAPSHLGPRPRVGSASAPYVYSPPLSSQSISFPPPANLSALLNLPTSELNGDADPSGDAGFDPNVASTLLRALQSENTNLRTKLADARSDADRQSRLSESYRSELVHLRRTAGLDIADLLSAVPEEQGVSDTGSQHPQMSSSIRIPGAARSPPVRSRSESRSLYSPASASFSPDTAFSGAASTSLSSASVSLAPSRSGTSAATTPSVSYTTPTVPASTPVHHALGLPSIEQDPESGISTPFGSSTSSSSLNASGTARFQHRPPAYRVPPPSLASSLGSTSGFPQQQPGAVSPYALSTSPIPEHAAEETLSVTGSQQGRKESLQRRLSNSRNGARVAETGVIPDRRSMQQKASRSSEQ